MTAFAALVAVLLLSSGAAEGSVGPSTSRGVEWVLPPEAAGQLAAALGYGEGPLGVTEGVVLDGIAVETSRVVLELRGGDGVRRVVIARGATPAAGQPLRYCERGGFLASGASPLGGAERDFTCRVLDAVAALPWREVSPDLREVVLSRLHLVKVPLLALWGGLIVAGLRRRRPAGDAPPAPGPSPGRRGHGALVVATFGGVFVGLALLFHGVPIDASYTNDYVNVVGLTVRPDAGSVSQFFQFVQGASWRTVMYLLPRVQLNHLFVLMLAVAAASIALFAHVTRRDAPRGALPATLAYGGLVVWFTDLFVAKETGVVLLPSVLYLLLLVSHLRRPSFLKIAAAGFLVGLAFDLHLVVALYPVIGLFVLLLEGAGALGAAVFVAGALSALAIVSPLPLGLNLANAHRLGWLVPGLIAAVAAAWAAVRAGPRWRRGSVAARRAWVLAAHSACLVVLVGGIVVSGNDVSTTRYYIVYLTAPVWLAALGLHAWRTGGARPWARAAWAAVVVLAAAGAVAGVWRAVALERAQLRAAWFQDEAVDVVRELSRRGYGLADLYRGLRGWRSDDVVMAGFWLAADGALATGASDAATGSPRPEVRLTKGDEVAAGPDGVVLHGTAGARIGVAFFRSWIATEGWTRCAATHDGTRECRDGALAWTDDLRADVGVLVPRSLLAALERERRAARIDVTVPVRVPGAGRRSFHLAERCGWRFEAVNGLGHHVTADGRCVVIGTDGPTDGVLVVGTDDAVCARRDRMPELDECGDGVPCDGACFLLSR